MQTQHEQSTRLYPGDRQTAARRVRKLLILAAWVAVGLQFVLMAIRHQHLTPLFLIIMSAVVIYIAALAFVIPAVVYRVLKFPTLIASPDGIEMKSHVGPSLPLIPWNEIQSFQTISILGLPMLKIIPRDFAQMKRRLGKNWWLYWWPGGFGINLASIPIPPKQLIAELEEFRQ
jgi:hypothetical protein